MLSVSWLYSLRWQDDWWMWSSWWNENWQGTQMQSEKICPSTTLSVTNHIWPEKGFNTSHCSENLATNYPNYGMANVLYPDADTLKGNQCGNLKCHINETSLTLPDHKRTLVWGRKPLLCNTNMQEAYKTNNVIWIKINK